MVELNLSRTQRFLIGGAIAICVIAIVVSLVGRGNHAEDVTMHNTRPYQAPGTKPAAQATYLTVHVVGEVGRPGVYRVRAGSRVYDAIAAAGGFTPRADQQSVNLASFVSDGQQVEVPAGGEKTSDGAVSKPYRTIQPREWPSARPRPAAGSHAGQAGGATNRSVSPQSARGASRHASPRGATRSTHSEKASGAPTCRINVNTAPEAELQRLPGIGPELSSRIVQYRARHGPFRDSADLKKVNGIGDKTVADITAYISY